VKRRPRASLICARRVQVPGATPVRSHITSPCALAGKPIAIGTKPVPSRRGDTAIATLAVPVESNAS